MQLIHAWPLVTVLSIDMVIALVMAWRVMIGLGSFCPRCESGPYRTFVGIYACTKCDYGWVKF